VSCRFAGHGCGLRIITNRPISRRRTAGRTTDGSRPAIVATVDNEDGVVKIVDRAKYLVEVSVASGSARGVDLENALMGHPAVDCERSVRG